MLLATARIYRFPDPGDRNRLTVRDRLDLHGAAQSIAGAGFRCVIGRETEGLRHDFVQLVPGSEVLPAWTFVREGPAIRAWRGTGGADLGKFTTLADALAAALAADPVRRRKPASH